MRTIAIVWDSMDMKDEKNISLEKGLDLFLTTLSGRNVSALTIRAYKTDISQFITFLCENNILIKNPADVTRQDISEYFSALSQKGISGVSRSRKLSAIKEYFKYLMSAGFLPTSPVEYIESPKKEKNSRTYLLPAEYTKMLSLAGGNARDYAILQVFLQTGIRVSELTSLTVNAIDLINATITVQGKGQREREISLEKKAVQAVRSYLAVRPQSISSTLFFNYMGDPISDRGIRKLMVKYRKEAGITKKASCHSLRHTFATYKAEHGVSPFQLQQWLGHANLNTTQIYVHLGRQNAKKIMEQTGL